MADFIRGEAFAELPELDEINRDFNAYVQLWEKKYGGRQKAAQYAYDWFHETLQDRDSTYVEPVSGQNLTWGKLYHFRYDPVTRDRLAYFDKSPMVISLGQNNKGLEVGININFLPKVVRYWMVGEIFRVYEKSFISASDGNRWRRANEQDEVQIDYQLLEANLGKWGLGHCVRQYYYNKMSDVSVICYEDWIRGVMINWNDYEGIQENDIKTLYEQYVIKLRKK